MNTITAVVKDCQPNDLKPGVDLYLPEEVRSQWKLQHRDEIGLVLDDDGPWVATVGIKPPNPPYLHRPVRRHGQKMSLRDWLNNQGLGHQAAITLAVEGWRSLGWMAVSDWGQRRSAATHAQSRRRKGLAGSSSTTVYTSGLIEEAATPAFPVDRPDLVRRYADSEYWQLIRSD